MRSHSIQIPTCVCGKRLESKKDLCRVLGILLSSPCIRRLGARVVVKGIQWLRARVYHTEPGHPFSKVSVCIIMLRPSVKFSVNFVPSTISVVFSTAFVHTVYYSVLHYWTRRFVLLNAEPTDKGDY